MKKFILSTAFIAATLFTGTCIVSCSDDDDDNNQPPGNAVISIENITTKKYFVQSGTFDALQPGEQTTIKFNAGKGQKLSFVTQYAYSNDMFFAPANPGIELFDKDGVATTGNVSDQVKLWDNGTRVNQVPGANIERPGTAESANVTEVPGTDAQLNTYPAASELMRVQLEFNSATSEFTATITNTSTGNTRETPFSEGVWIVSNFDKDDDDKVLNAAPFFDAGYPTRSTLTALAENGNIQPLADYVAANTGIITNLSPAIVLTYTGNTNPIYTINQAASSALKVLAQKGETDDIKSYLEGLSNVRKVYVLGGSSSVLIGEKMESQFEAYEGENIAFATAFKYSNDWFFSNGSTISATQKGDITSSVVLLDSGTAVNQYPGAGNNQVIFDGTPQAENNPITVVDNTYPVPAVSSMIRVTLR